MPPHRPQQSADAANQKAADSLRPIDHARMVLVPVLLTLSAGFLVFGPGTLFENAGLAAALVLFAVLNGQTLYQTWRKHS